MNTQCLELTGWPTMFEISPPLEITWHKIPNEIYCYDARLIFESPLTFDLVRVEIKTISITDPSNERHVSESVITRYLPCHREDDKIIVDLNSTEFVEAIGLCAFTKKAKGGKCNLVQYPAAISFYYGDEEQTYPFIEGLPPKMICKTALDLMNTGDKVTVHINLKG